MEKNRKVSILIPKIRFLIWLEILLYSLSLSLSHKYPHTHPKSECKKVLKRSQKGLIHKQYHIYINHWKLPIHPQKKKKKPKSQNPILIISPLSVDGPCYHHSPFSLTLLLLLSQNYPHLLDQAHYCLPQAQGRFRNCQRRC